MIECVGAMVSDALAEQRRLDAEMRDVWRGRLARRVVEARSLTRTEAEMINRNYTRTNCRICLRICFHFVATGEEAGAQRRNMENLGRSRDGMGWL